jgi:hypothetical protein
MMSYTRSRTGRGTCRPQHSTAQHSTAQQLVEPHRPSDAAIFLLCRSRVLSQQSREKRTTLLRAHWNIHTPPPLTHTHTPPRAAVTAKHTHCCQCREHEPGQAHVARDTPCLSDLLQAAWCTEQTVLPPSSMHMPRMHKAEEPHLTDHCWLKVCAPAQRQPTSAPSLLRQCQRLLI